MILEQAQGVIGFDLETTINYTKDSDPYRDRIISIAVGNEHERVLLEDNFERVFPLLKNPNVLKIAHNAEFDLRFILQKFGFLPENIWDSLMIERLIHAGDLTLSHGLGDVLQRRLGQYVNKSVRNQFRNFEGMMTDEQRQYALSDVRWSVPLYQSQLEDVGRLGLGRAAAVENELVRVVAKATLRGISYDGDLWEEYSSWVDGKVNGLEKELADYWDISYMDSLFDDTVVLADKIGNPAKVKKWLASVGVMVESTGVDLLKAVVDEHPSVQVLLDWRTWDKLAGWGYGKHVNPATEKIHPGWNQMGTTTGRFSSSNPNMQNVPRPRPDEPNLRNLFPPREGYIYVVCDYSQQEPRIYAQLCQDPAFLAACNERDVYMAFAPTVYGEEIIKDDPRRHMLKTGVLAVGYGAGPKTLTKRMGIDYDAAVEFSNTVNRAFPGMRNYRERQVRDVLYTSRGRTLLGRTRIFDVEFYHRLEHGDGRKFAIKNEIVNQPVQGTAADMFKTAMIQLDKKLADYDAHQLIFVHDEFVVEVKENQAQEVAQIVQATMEEAGQKLCPDVSIIAEAKITERWSK